MLPEWPQWVDGFRVALFGQQQTCADDRLLFYIYFGRLVVFCKMVFEHQATMVVEVGEVHGEVDASCLDCCTLF